MSEQTLVPGRVHSRPWWPRTAAAAIAAAVVAVTIAACGNGRAGPAVPSASANAGVAGHARALHLAGQCIRQHGIPGFPDPTVNASGQATTAKTQLQDVPKAVLSQAIRACQAALDRAGFQAGSSNGGRPGPQQLHAYLAFARCLRAHGVTGLADPSPVTGDLSLPPGMTKNSPVLLRAQQACQSLLSGAG